jgi:hypothetical protein
MTRVVIRNAGFRTSEPAWFAAYTFVKLDTERSWDDDLGFRLTRRETGP